MRSTLTSARAAVLAACAAACLSGCELFEATKPPVIVFHATADSADAGTVEVTQIPSAVLGVLSRASLAPDQWQDILGVYAGDRAAADTGALPMLGRYSVAGDRLRFSPRFPPVPDQPYFVRFNGNVLRRLVGLGSSAAYSVTVDTVVEIARGVNRRVAAVDQVYPSAEHVPVNLLRLYIHFTEPMSIGEAAQRIRLVDDNELDVRDAFLVTPQELWDPDRRRLTLLFDPGRIKRDLRPNQELGLPLHQGRSYRLVIDSAWKDGNGTPMVAAFTKTFTVGPADRSSPRTADWRMTSPSRERQPLIVAFPESLDRALLGRMLTVRRADGRLVSGQATIEAEETRWSFVPDQPWLHGSYVLEIDTSLEDLAGNNLRDVFDVDRTRPRAPGETGAIARMPFRIE